MKTSMELKGFLAHLLLFSIVYLIPLSTNASQKNEYITISQADIDSTKPDSRLFNQTYQQTTDHTCGAAVVMTLLHYYGRFHPSQLNSKTELRIAQEMGAANKGTTLSQVVNWLSHNGFRVDSGFRVSSSLIIDNLKRGIPTIISRNNHWLVAKGFNQGSTPQETTIYFADSSRNMTMISASDIDSMWIESQSRASHSNNRGEYIVARPI